MSAAAMAGRVGGPTYLSGSSLGTAGDGVAALEATAPVDRDADEQAPSVIADHASTDGKDFTCTPRKVETGAGCRSLPRRLRDQHDRFKRHIQTGPPSGGSRSVPTERPGSRFPQSVLPFRPRRLAGLENPGGRLRAVRNPRHRVHLLLARPHLIQRVAV